MYYRLYPQESERLRELVSPNEYLWCLRHGTFYRWPVYGEISTCASSTSPNIPEPLNPFRLLDLVHSAFIGASLYQYFVAWFGEESQIDVIPWSIAVREPVTESGLPEANLFCWTIYSSQWSSR